MERSLISGIMRRFNRHKRGLSARTIMHPLREWWVCILIAIVIFTAAGLWGTVLYTSYDDEFIGSGTESVKIPYSAKRIEDALDKYRTRRDEFNSGSYSAPATQPIETVPERAVVSTSKPEVIELETPVRDEDEAVRPAL
jgi:hypothetical protein